MTAKYRSRTKRGSMRNPARGVVDLRYANPPRPNARNPYYATWYDRVLKRKGGSQAFAELPEAIRWIEHREAENLADHGQGPTVQRRGRSLQEVVDGWLPTVARLAHNTSKGYRSNANNLLRHFGAETPVAAITEDDIEQWLGTELRIRKLAPGTVIARLNVLNQLMTYARKRGFRTDNPCEDVSSPKRRRRAAYIFTDAEFESLLTHTPRRYHLAMILGYYAALRIGEATGLRAEHLDATTGTVRITRIRHKDGTVQDYAKNGQDDEYALLPESVLPQVRELLDEFPPAEDGSVCTHKDRHAALVPLGQDALRVQFRKGCMAAGLPVEQNRIRFHDLRHSSATHYAESNAPAYIIQEHLRHASLSNTQRYISDVKQEQRREWSNRVAS